MTIPYKLIYPYYMAEMIAGLNQGFEKTSQPENSIKNKVAKFARRVLSFSRHKTTEIPTPITEQPLQPAEATVIKPTIETDRVGVLQAQLKNTDFRGSGLNRADALATGQSTAPIVDRPIQDPDSQPLTLAQPGEAGNQANTLTTITPSTETG